jgi:transforming growth factor-beta-induced protein
MPSQPVASAQSDIIDTMVGIESLHAFSSAIVAGGLLKKLRGGGPFTVFAPTDAAFGRIDEHVLQRWLLPERKAQLSGVLTYHVLLGRLSAAEITKASSARTLQGTRLTIRFAEGRMHVNNAAVIQCDIECSNGFIHIIDTVVIIK